MGRYRGGMKGETERRLLFEHDEFVADEIPDERKTGSKEFANIGPELGSDIDNVWNVARETRDDAAVDEDADDADDKELGELDRRLLILNVCSGFFECPAAIHVIAVDYCYRE